MFGNILIMHKPLDIKEMYTSIQDPSTYFLGNKFVGGFTNSTYYTLDNNHLDLKQVKTRQR